MRPYKRVVFTVRYLCECTVVSLNELQPYTTCCFYCTLPVCVHSSFDLLDARHKTFSLCSSRASCTRGPQPALESSLFQFRCEPQRRTQCMQWCGHSSQLGNQVSQPLLAMQQHTNTRKQHHQQHHSSSCINLPLTLNMTITLTSNPNSKHHRQLY